ncbi:TetR/AcrR family transcriptional regulator [Prevotellamassilia timonensis]|jgi:AcrR family transcriptional regulator|uniref:TetR/AcrR family transcriptional regulator n=1 Tax=Prevotellamassilia timonensis TaxID=1852370 RepID=UPI003FD80F02|nr:TetR/AcrR family transcriptional regulator [Prevotellamassilia timonensis]
MTNDGKRVRIRRTKATITENIRKAAVESVLKRGFSGSLVSEIIKKAKIEPVVFYNRYQNLEEFFSEFVKGYDYWFSDVAKEANKLETPHDQFIALIEGLQECMIEKSVMLELIRWEIAVDNDITKRTASIREMFTLPLAEKYDDLFKNSGIDFVAIATIIVSGLYYLYLHKDRSTFCNIDMNTEEGRNRVNQAIKFLSELLFSKRNMGKENLQL